jgi:phage terminase small subunit
MPRPSLRSLPSSSRGDIEEPCWADLIPDQDDGESNENWRRMAHEEWGRVLSCLQAAGTLGREDRHQLQRLVIAYVRYNRAASKLFATGETRGKWQFELRAADTDARAAEVELGMPPRRRSQAVRSRSTEKQAQSAHGASRYLTV